MLSLILFCFGACKQKNYHGLNRGQKTLEWNLPFAKWFVGGKINASYNTLDVHQNNRAQKPAILWEGEDGATRTVTYQDLFSLCL